MPFDIQWESRGTFTKFWGFVSGEDIFRHSMAIDSDPRFEDIRYNIVDFLDVDGFSVSETDMLILSANDYGAAHTNPNIRIAVVTADERAKALVRTYAGPPLEPFPTKIFDSVAEARHWVESEPPLDRPRKRPGLPAPVEVI